MKMNRFPIIIYVVYLFLALFLFIILEHPFLLLTLLPFVAAPFFSILIFRHVVSQLQFRAYCKTASVDMGNPVLFSVEAKNPSFFPLLKCELTFHTENIFRPNPINQVLNIPLNARKKGVFEIPLEAQLPGMVTFHITKICVSDYLNFVTITLPETCMAQIPVLPAPKEFPPPEKTVSSEGEDEVEDNSNHGMPSSDIKEIREYRPGDKLQRIHWKLSAKLDDLVVKELSNTSVLSIVLLPELSRNNITETTETLRSLMEYFIDNEQRFELCLYQHADCSFEYILVSNRDELLDCFIKFYYLTLYEEEDAALNAFFASGQHGSSIIQIKGTEFIHMDSALTVF